MIRQILLHSFLLCSVIILSSAECRRARSKLIGYWEIYKIESGHDSNPTLKRSKFMRFKNNGTCLGGQIDEEHDQSGVWILNDTKNTLEIKSNIKKEDDGVFSILELTRKSLVIRKGGLTVYMDHGDK